MAQLHFVKKARKSIYEIGKQVTYSGQVGSKREGRTMHKLDRTIPANSKDKVLVSVGESYYWWQFKRGPVHISKTRPKRSQLTQSEFKGWLYDLEDDISTFHVPPDSIQDYSVDDLEMVVDEWLDEIETMRDELEGRLDNMPENLRDNSISGQMLQERVDALDDWHSALDSERGDIEWDDEELKQAASNEWEDLSEEEQTRFEQEKGTAEDWIQDRFIELKRERIEECIMNLQGISCDAG